jgi:double zinc ribbon protein
MSLALFGIENDGVNLAVNLLVFFLVVIWLALVYWTYSDAQRRIDDPMLIGCATAASLFPFIGTIVYTIVRPPEYLEDTQERELEMKAAQARLTVLESQTCRNCGTAVEASFLRCPSCMRRLREPCQSCGKPLEPHWRLCPYCETPQAQPKTDRGQGDRSRSQRRSERAESRQGGRGSPASSPPPASDGAGQRSTRPLTREGRLSEQARRST